jgi:hypothetical protein
MAGYARRAGSGDQERQAGRVGDSSRNASGDPARRNNRIGRPGHPP